MTRGFPDDVPRLRVVGHREHGASDIESVAARKLYTFPSMYSEMTHLCYVALVRWCLWAQVVLSLRLSRFVLEVFDLNSRLFCRNSYSCGNQMQHRSNCIDVGDVEVVCDLCYSPLEKRKKSLKDESNCTWAVLTVLAVHILK